MIEKILVFSLLIFLTGSNVYFMTQNILGLLFLGTCAVASVIFFVYGMMKDKRETRKIRSWQKPFSSQIEG